MLVAGRELRKQCFVELDVEARINRVNTIFFINRLAQHQSPSTVPLFEEIIKPAGTNDVAQDAVDRGTLGDRSLCLSDSTETGKVNHRSAEGMPAPHTFRPAIAANIDEL